jgi:hypothetical protein
MRAKFVVVDGAGAVHGDGGEPAAFNEIDEVSADTGAEQVGTHDEDARGTAEAGFVEAGGDVFEVVVLEGGVSASSGSQCSSWQIVDAFGEGANAEAAAVELGIFAMHGESRRPEGRRAGSWGR